MSKFLLRANYTQAGVGGLLKEGGSKRREALQATIEGVGGTLESFYFALGDTDLFLIADLPDKETATAVSLSVKAAGVLEVLVTELLEPEAIDAASKKSVPYRVPGN